jgi:hypothetical protein
MAPRAARSSEKIVVQIDADRRDLVLPAGEAAHPGAVAEQQMIEGAVDRLEEGAAIALALGIVDPGADGINLLVHPLIVASEGLKHVCVWHAIRSRAVGATAQHGAPVPWLRRMRPSLCRERVAAQSLRRHRPRAEGVAAACRVSSGTQLGRAVIW